MGEQQCHIDSIKMNDFQCHNTLSLLLFLDICLAHIAMSNQHHLCWELSTELGRLLHAGANISFICKEPYFFQNEWGGRDIIGPRLLFSTKANTRNIFKERILVCFLFLPSFFFFFELLNDYAVAKTRHTIYTKITFLYKRQKLGLHYFDSKNIDDIAVKQQVTLQNFLYVHRKLLDFSVIFIYFLIACFWKLAMLTNLFINLFLRIISPASFITGMDKWFSTLYL